MRDTAHTHQLFEEQVESSFFSNLPQKGSNMECGNPAPNFGNESLNPPSSYQPPPKQLTRRMLVRSFSEIDVEKVEWIWHDRLPRGKFSLLAGHPGTGKSYLTCDIAARISRGGEFPDGTPCTRGRVLFINLEDGAGDTIKKRLDDHGADHSMIINVDGIGTSEVDSSFCLQRDLQHLEDLMSQMPDLQLVVIDPLSGAMGTTDTHKAASVKRTLTPLLMLAERQDVAILAVEHLKKGCSDGPAIHAILGSVSIAGSARAAWGLIRDPADTEYRILQVIKNNLAPDTGRTGLRFRNVNGVLEWDKEPVECSADLLMSESLGHDLDKVEEAGLWLEDHLKEPMFSNDVKRAAGEKRIKPRTLDRARKSLGIKAVQRDRKWHWLPLGVESFDEWQASNLN